MMPAAKGSFTIAMVVGWCDAFLQAFLDEREGQVAVTELRGLAGHYLRGQAPGHVLQTTALVNKA
jgi:hypothetical protein